MSQSNGTSIHVLMSKVMADIGVIGKNQKNTQQGFVFRGIDDVMNAVHGSLTKHGVFYAPNVLECEYMTYTTKNGTGMKSASLKVAYTFYGPAGDYVTVTTQGEASDSGDKATNKALAAALKYALLHTFCIPTEEQVQDDADRQSHEADWSAPSPVPKEFQALLDEGYTQDAITEIADEIRKEKGDETPVSSFDQVIKRFKSVASRKEIASKVQEAKWGADGSGDSSAPKPKQESLA